jgi:GntR family transcriptional regulator/MocR family aminotransferase
MLIDARKVPYYIQLYDYFKKEILGGMLPADTRLPSIRSLAAQLNISATPVELAYQQLLSEGFIASKPRSGYLVQPIYMLSGIGADTEEKTGLDHLPLPVLPIPPVIPGSMLMIFISPKMTSPCSPTKSGAASTRNSWRIQICCNTVIRRANRPSAAASRHTCGNSAACLVRQSRS